MFEELDRRATPMGEISLRRRRELTLDVDVWEAKLDDEFLMSTLFVAAEVALGELGLAACTGDRLDVVVGGLGLGYTAQTVLADPRIASLQVVEALDEVIDWHRRELLPLSAALVADERCRFVRADFFATVADERAFDPAAPGPVDAILVDIDHSPSRHLHPSHESFYDPPGLAQVAARLHPGGVFALWSDDPPEPPFVAALESVFVDVESHVVEFPNPYTGASATNTVHVARTPPA